MDKNRDGLISKMEMIEFSPHLTISQVDAVFRRNEKKHDPQEFKRSENAEVPVKSLRESPQQDQK